MNDDASPADTVLQPAEMPERMGRILRNARIVYPELDPVKRVGHDLWNNPDAFAEGEMIPDYESMAVEELAFRMGVLFGIEYEQTYPEGMRDEWPIDEAERPVTDQ